MKSLSASSGAESSILRRLHRRVTGIGATMFGAFCAITLMSVIAGVVAWTSFADISARFASVTTKSVPAMTDALNLSVEGSSLAAAIADLAAVRTEDERARLVERLSDEASQFRWRLGKLNERLAAEGKPKVGEELAAEMQRNLATVGERLKTMLQLRKQQKETLLLIHAAHEALVRLLATQGQTKLDDVTTATDRVRYLSGDDYANQILSGVLETVSLSKAESHANRMLALLEAVSQTTDVELLTSQEVDFNTAAHDLERIVFTTRNEIFTDGASGWLRLSELKTGPTGLMLQVESSWGAGTLRSKLIGEFNAENLLAALGVLLGWRVPLQQALVALAACVAPPRVIATFPRAAPARAQTARPTASPKATSAVRRPATATWPSTAPALARAARPMASSKEAFAARRPVLATRRRAAPATTRPVPMTALPRATCAAQRLGCAT